jgi:hypothetical protein
MSRAALPAVDGWTMGLEYGKRIVRFVYARPEIES